MFSPNGGPCIANAMSDPEDASQWQAEDVISRRYKHDPRIHEARGEHQGSTISRGSLRRRRRRGRTTATFTFEDAANLHRKFVEFYELHKVTAALCHGVAVLRYTRLSSGEPLAKGKTVTGFADIEEDFSDDSVWSIGLLAEDTPRHVVAHRGATNSKRSEPTMCTPACGEASLDATAPRDWRHQNFSGGETADLILAALGR